MTPKARRSWLIVPASGSAQIDAAARSGADVVVLDMVELVAERDRVAARERARSAIESLAAGGREVFVQVTPASMASDLRACASPALTGIVISRVESTAEVDEAASLLAGLEKERGIARELEIVAALETARGNQDAFEIARASPRIRALTLGRADLVMDLRPEPSGEIHLMTYLMQRLVIIAGTLGVTPLGAWWRAPDRGLLATPENTAKAAQRGRAIGFKGAMCLRADQVEPLNRAFAGA